MITVLIVLCMVPVWLWGAFITLRLSKQLQKDFPRARTTIAVSGFVLVGSFLLFGVLIAVPVLLMQAGLDQIIPNWLWILGPLDGLCLLASGIVFRYFLGRKALRQVRRPYAAPSASLARGSVKLKRLPAPRVDSTQICP